MSNLNINSITFERYIFGEEKNNLTLA